MSKASRSLPYIGEVMVAPVAAEVGAIALYHLRHLTW